MKRVVVCLCLLLPLVGSRSVEASTFTLSSVDVDVRDADPGLVLWHSIPYIGDIVLDGAGASKTITLFTLGTREEALNLDDIYRYPINVGLTFSQPVLYGAVAGLTGALFGGYVHWDSPIELVFGSAGEGLLQIALSNARFGLPGDAPISATFTLLQDVQTAAATPVPEPGTLALMGVGAAAVALRRRRQRR